MGEAALSGLQGAALRVVGVEPAGPGLQSPTGHWPAALPLRPAPRLRARSPVPDVDPPTFHWRRRRRRKEKDEERRRRREKDEEEERGGGGKRER